MKTMRTMTLVAAIMAAALPLFAGSYTIKELGLPKDASVTPHAINNQGVVTGGVGEAHGGNLQLFTWDGTRGPKLLERASGSDYAEAMAINDAGQVAGAMNGETALAAFTWDSASGTRNLAPLAGDNASTAAAINAAGAIAGTSMGASGIHAVVWQPGAAAAKLADLAGSDSSTALGIDANGNVVGWATVNGVKHAVLWSGGHARDLGDSAQAYSVNAAGQIAGISDKLGNTRAVLWTASGAMTDLGTLAGGKHSEAFAINSAGQVVGSSGSSNGLRAVLWTPSGMVDLNTLIPNNSNLVLMVAVAINDKGQILALGSLQHNLVSDKTAHMDMHLHAGATRAFLLTPQ